MRAQRQRQDGGFSSVAITCRAHGGSCRRVFSQRQLDELGLGDGQTELLEWLLLAVNKRVHGEASHCALPKPLPELMKGGGDPLDTETVAHDR